MGCFASTQRHSPAQPATAASSRAASPIGAAVQAAGPPTSPGQRRTTPPLKKPKPWRATSRSWTHRQLRREREIFWETQVAGRAEIWSTVHVAVDMVRPPSADADVDSALEGAKTILDAAGLTCPSGRLSEGIWDEQGVLYKVPRWVVSDPVNVMEDDPEEEDGEDDAEDDEESKEAAGLYDGTDEKGKARDVEPGPDAVTVKTRLSDRGTDVNITIGKDQHVRALIRRIQVAAEIPQGTRVKIAYMGKMLKDNDSLPAQGWHEGHVVNVLVFA